MSFKIQLEGEPAVHPSKMNLSFPPHYIPMVGDIIYQDFYELGDYNAYVVVEREVRNHMYSGGDMTEFRVDNAYVVVHVRKHVIEGS